MRVYVQSHYMKCVAKSEFVEINPPPLLPTLKPVASGTYLRPYGYIIFVTPPIHYDQLLSL